MALWQTSNRFPSSDIAVYDRSGNRPPSGFRFSGMLGRDLGNDKLEMYLNGSWTPLLQPMAGRIGTYSPTGGAVSPAEIRNGRWAIQPNGICIAWGYLSVIAMTFGTIVPPTSPYLFSLPFARIDEDNAIGEAIVGNIKYRKPIGVGWVYDDLLNTWGQGTCIPTIAVGAKTFSIEYPNPGTVSPRNFAFCVEYAADFSNPSSTTEPLKV